MKEKIEAAIAEIDALVKEKVYLNKITGEISGGILCDLLKTKQRYIEMLRSL